MNYETELCIEEHKERVGLIHGALRGLSTGAIVKLLTSLALTYFVTAAPRSEEFFKLVGDTELLEKNQLRFFGEAMSKTVKAYDQELCMLMVLVVAHGMLPTSFLLPTSEDLN